MTIDPSPVGGSGPFPARLDELGDLDGDGLPEWLAGDVQNRRVDLMSIRGALRTHVGGGHPTQYGAAVTGLDDLDSDGVPDYAIGAPGQARVFVHSGSTGALLRELAGVQRFGAEVAGRLDVDGDGVGDLVVHTEPLLNGNFRRLEVISGRTWQRILDVPTANLGDGFGLRIVTLGDLNGDGRDDFAFGQYAHDRPGFSPLDNAGRVVALSGSDGSILFEYLGEGNQQSLGFSVARLEDVDGDGVADLAAGAPGLDSRVRVFSGATGVEVVTILPTDFGPHTIGALGVISGLGGLVMSPGDLNGDGLSDLCITGKDSNVRGIVLVWLGGATIAYGLAPAHFITGLVRTGDIDANGHPDFCFAASLNAGAVRYYCHSGWSEIGTDLCAPSVANSTGFVANLRALGTSAADENDVSFFLENLPSSAPGMLLGANIGDRLPVVQGNGPCIGGPGLIRFASSTWLLPTGIATVGRRVDLTSFPVGPWSAISVVSGETWAFQAIFRDQGTVRSSNAVAVTFE